MEYSDFQCPYCGRFAKETLPALVARYVDNGQVLLVFRHLPLENIHPQALAAGVAAHCAGEQGRFWPMHDGLFASSNLERKVIQDLGREIGLDYPAFEACQAGPGATMVRAEAAAANALGITGTPTFLFGTLHRDGTIRVTHRLAGAIRMGQVEPVLTALLQSVGSRD